MAPRVRRRSTRVIEERERRENVGYPTLAPRVRRRSKRAKSLMSGSGSTAVARKRVSSKPRHLRKSCGGREGGGNERYTE